MLTLAVLSGPWPRIGVIAAALLAGSAILARRDVPRAWAMLGAMVLAPVLLLDDVWHSSSLSIVHRHPLEAAVAGVLALGVVGGAALVIHRRPVLVPILSVIALPFRIPIAVGSASATQTGNSANLLLPLYFVVGASALAWIVPTLWTYHREGRADAAQRPPRHVFEWVLAAYLVLYAVQSLYSPAFLNALQNEVFFYVPFAVLLALLRDVDWNRELLVRCLQFTVALAVIAAFVGFGEEITQTLWLNSKLLASNQLHEYFQVNSVFYDPDIFGRYLALVMVLLVTVLLYDRRTRSQLGAIAVLAILWGCLIFTLSRSSLLALTMGMVVLGTFRWPSRTVLTAAGAVVVAGVVAVALHPSSFGYSFNGATSGRSSLITNGISLFTDRPLQGWGSGSFSTEYTRKFRRAARAVSDSHNIPVTVASEQGLIGLAFYAALVIAAILTLARGVRSDPYRLGILAAFLALLLHTMLYADFLEDPVTWALLGIGGALAGAAGTRSPAAEGERPGARRQRIGV